MESYDELVKRTRKQLRIAEHALRGRNESGEATDWALLNTLDLVIQALERGVLEDKPNEHGTRCGACGAHSDHWD